MGIAVSTAERLAGTIADAVASVLSVHPSPGLAAVGFSVALVSWLVAAEEAELRRGRATPG